MNDDVNEEKTENPTEYKLEKFRKKGTTRYSKELNSLLILFFGFMSLWWCGNLIFLNFSRIMSYIFSFNNSDIFNQKNILLEIHCMLKEMLVILTPFLICLFLITVIPSLLFSGIRLNFNSLRWNFNKLNLLSGLKKIFSLQITVEFLKIILKLFITTSICCFYLWSVYLNLLLSIKENYTSILLHGYSILTTCCFLVLIGLVPIVIFDIFWQQFTHHKKLKMTIQEIKEESREREGNSTVKVRIRQLMKAAAQKRMFSNISNADVIITNPIHYSIALQYNEEQMNAPKVIAKGVGHVAIQIKNIAIKNNISIISSPSLARALYRYSEIGQYIPGSLYQAVAEILAWVWKVRKWKKEGGVFPEKPKNILVPSELNFTGEHKTND